MTIGDYAALLSQARSVLERYMFDRVDLRDDVPEICAEIDDVLPPATDRNAPRVLQGIARHNMERVRTTCSEFFSMFEL
jgi:hypothetical protein